MNNQYKTYRNVLNKVIKTAKNKFLIDKISNTQGNSKLTWKIINEMLGKSQTHSNDRFVISLDIKFSSFFRTAGLKEEKMTVWHQ